LEKREDVRFIGGTHLSSGHSAAPLLNCHHGFPRRKKERRSGTFTQRRKKHILPPRAEIVRGRVPFSVVKKRAKLSF